MKAQRTSRIADPSLSRLLVWAAALAILALGALVSPASARSGPDYQKLVRPEAVENMVRRLAGISSRATGSPGCDEAAEIIRKALVSYGMAPLVETFETPMPVQRTARLHLPARKRDIQLDAIWPNLTRTSTVHRDGVAGHLLYVGAGEYADFNGLDMAGSIVAMDFNSGDNMINARVMGAKAIIFIEPVLASRREAEQKWLATPSDIPRFWVSRAEGEVLKRLGVAYANQREAARKPFGKELAELRGQLAKARLAIETAIAEGKKSTEIQQAQAFEKAAEQKLDALLGKMRRALKAVPKAQVRLFAKIKWETVRGKNVWAWFLVSSKGCASPTTTRWRWPRWFSPPAPTKRWWLSSSRWASSQPVSPVWTVACSLSRRWSTLLAIWAGWVASSAPTRSCCAPC